MNFRENLKMYREKAGYSSAKEFAKALDIPYSQYSSYESPSRPHEPKYDLLCTIAQKLDITPNDLLAFEDNRFDSCCVIARTNGYKVAIENDTVIIDDSITMSRNDFIEYIEDAIESTNDIIDSISPTLMQKYLLQAFNEFIENEYLQPAYQEQFEFNKMLLTPPYSAISGPIVSEKKYRDKALTDKAAIDEKIINAKKLKRSLWEKHWKKNERNS